MRKTSSQLPWSYVTFCLEAQCNYRLSLYISVQSRTDYITQVLLCQNRTESTEGEWLTPVNTLTERSKSIPFKWGELITVNTSANVNVSVPLAKEDPFSRDQFSANLLIPFAFIITDNGQKAKDSSAQPRNKRLNLNVPQSLNPEPSIPSLVWILIPDWLIHIS